MSVRHLDRRLLARLAAGLGAACLVLVLVALARADTKNCYVNASGGYANCNDLANPVREGADAQHATGLPYRFQLVRFSDGATWGWWEWNDLDPHIVAIGPSGTITAQVDNRGSANPALYLVKMEQ